jgi:hypothetical protein
MLESYAEVGNHVKVNAGLREGSSSKGCLPEVSPRCVVAKRRNAWDISSTLSVRRVDLSTFTMSATCCAIPRPSCQTAPGWAHGDDT